MSMWEKEILETIGKSPSGTAQIVEALKKKHGRKVVYITVYTTLHRMRGDGMIRGKNIGGRQPAWVWWSKG